MATRVRDFEPAFRVNSDLDVSHHLLTYQVEDLAAGTGISARPVFIVPPGFKGKVVDVRIISQGTAAGIDNSNTCVVALANGSNAIVSKTYNATVTFPASGAADSLGTPSSTYGALAAGNILRLSVTNGTTANPPAFMLEVTYTLEAV